MGILNNKTIFMICQYPKNVYTTTTTTTTTTEFDVNLYVLVEAVRERHRKHGTDCYSMDSFACGFETRDCVPQTVSPRTAHFVSWNDAIVSYGLLLSFPDTLQIAV